MAGGACPADTIALDVARVRAGRAYGFGDLRAGSGTGHSRAPGAYIWPLKRVLVYLVPYPPPYALRTATRGRLRVMW